MTIYSGKLLELLSVDRHHDTSFLRVRLSFEQDIELLWEIDNETAENLQAATVLDENYKYRLSLRHTWDPAKKQHVSFVTKTYIDQSEKVYFTCSDDYIKGLDAIIHTQQLNDIHALSFLSINLPPVDGPEPESDRKKEKPNRFRTYRKFALLPVAVICALAIIMFGNPNHSSVNNGGFDQEALAKAESPKSDVVPSVSVEPIETVAAYKPKHPSFVLNEVKTFSIPEGKVAITFDDGPTKYTKKIVDLLKKYQVGGTFFFIGVNVKKYPEAVHYAYSNGYSIGSHSMSHANLAELPYDEQEDELVQSDLLIEDITHDKVDLFRPPYGAINDDTIKLMKSHQKKMVLWNSDPKDWKFRNATRIIDYVHHTEASGSILLLHGSQADLEALPKIIKYFQGKGLQIVSLK